MAADLPDSNDVLTGAERRRNIRCDDVKALAGTGIVAEFENLGTVDVDTGRTWACNVEGRLFWRGGQDEASAEVVGSCLVVLSADLCLVIGI